MAKVSIVIPSYNHAQFIPEALTSVLGQTFGDLELVVIDDGSEDDTFKVLSEFNDERMQSIEGYKIRVVSTSGS
jgi:glycosyltransferase involved in cell wall biosynthesis